MEDIDPMLLAQMHDLPEIRAEKVDSLRAAIAAGTYDEERKLSVALDRLLEEL